MSSAKRLYHGSPHDLATIEPRVATGKDGPAAQRNAVYMAETPEEASLYALIRPPTGRRGGWSIVNGQVHYVHDPAMPLNNEGYVYSHDFDDGAYRPPPADNPSTGYTVDSAFSPTERRVVRLADMTGSFVPHADKAALRAHLAQLRGDTEKTSAYNNTLWAAFRDELLRHIGEQHV